jgi:hypothetical protein
MEKTGITKLIFNILYSWSINVTEVGCTPPPQEEICNIGKMYLSHQTPAPPPRPLPFDRNCGGGGVMTEHFVVVGQFDFVFIKIFISQENKLTISDFQMYTEHREL